LETFLWPKTRYLNSGTVGWWENLIWAIEVTGDAQPRLVYWSGEDSEPVAMDWELHDQDEDVPALSLGLDRLVRWARDYLHDQPAAALAELATALQAPPMPEPEPMARIRELVADGVAPDAGTVAELLAAPASTNGWLDRAERALGRVGVLDDPLRLATAVLAGRGEPSLRGTDPRSLPRRLATGRPVGGPGIAPVLWPRLLTGTQGQASPEDLDAEEIIGALDEVARALPRDPQIGRP
jgi:hypothetical protein